MANHILCALATTYMNFSGTRFWPAWCSQTSHRHIPRAGPAGSADSYTSAVIAVSAIVQVYVCSQPGFRPLRRSFEDELWSGKPGFLLSFVGIGYEFGGKLKGKK